jgi:hypothetical protein
MLAAFATDARIASMLRPVILFSNKLRTIVILLFYWSFYWKLSLMKTQ